MYLGYYETILNMISINFFFEHGLVPSDATNLSIRVHIIQVKLGLHHSAVCTIGKKLAYMFGDYIGLLTIQMCS